MKEQPTMQCPHDQSVLVMTERKGVEIDYCPSCRGVWLDRGELDKIIDRSMEAEIAAEAGTPLRAAAPPAYPAAPRYGDGGPGTRAYDPRFDDRRYDERSYDDRRRDRGDDPRRGDLRRRKKKESWLEDLFDF